MYAALHSEGNDESCCAAAGYLIDGRGLARTESSGGRNMGKCKRQLCAVQASISGMTDAA
jgi:hypothetical protein